MIHYVTLHRLVREIIQQDHGDKYRIQSTAIESLQHASEAYLVNRFQVANTLAIHRKQVTVSPKQMVIVKKYITMKFTPIRTQ